MRLTIYHRLERLEARHAPVEPVTINIQIMDGRRPYQIFAGERLKPSAWPNHLLVPMDGLRPLGEPLPYPLERICP